MTAIRTSTLKRVRAYSNEILKIFYQGELIWPMGEPIVKNDPYVCFSALNTQAFYIIGNFNYYDIEDPNVYYSYDKQNWTLLTYYRASNGMRTRNINFGGNYGNVYLRGKNELGFHPNFNHGYYIHEPSELRYHFLFTNSNSVLLSGCLRALYDWENVDSDPTVNFSKKGGGFYTLFSRCTQITDASGLTIYADGDYFFDTIFLNCTNLQKGPKLPSVSLNDYGTYNSMFSGCSSLTQAPLLPATTLGKSCYSSMFSGCSSLTQAPELPATTLAPSCYYGMFSGCSSLTQAPELPATTLAPSCYYAMFNGTNIIPDCTNIDFSSETVVASGGLRGLFYGTKITYDLLSSILPKDSNNKPCLPVVNLAPSCYHGMFESCSLLTQTPLLPATNLAPGCYFEMFYQCSLLTQAPSILPATTLAERCYFYMFSACSSLTRAPELPATTLVDDCYVRMFENSSNLNYIKMMAIELPSGKSSTYMTDWVKGVSSTGTFVLNAAATWPSYNIGEDGRPSGWTVQTATS